MTPRQVHTPAAPTPTHRQTIQIHNGTPAKPTRPNLLDLNNNNVKTHPKHLEPIKLTEMQRRASEDDTISTSTESSKSVDRSTQADMGLDIFWEMFETNTQQSREVVDREKVNFGGIWVRQKKEFLKKVIFKSNLNIFIELKLSVDHARFLEKA